MKVTIEQLQQDIETLAMLVRVHSMEDQYPAQHAQSLAKAETPTRLRDIMARLAALRDEKIDESRTEPINTAASAQLTEDGGAVLKIEFTKAIKVLTLDASQTEGFVAGITKIAGIVARHEQTRAVAAASTKSGPIH